MNTRIPKTKKLFIGGGITPSQFIYTVYFCDGFSSHRHIDEWVVSSKALKALRINKSFDEILKKYIILDPWPYTVSRKIKQICLSLFLFTIKLPHIIKY